MEVLKVGSIARFESVRDGLVPCRVLTISGVSGPCSTEQRVTFRITRSGKGYEAGHIMDCFGLHVVPLKAVRRRKYSTRIVPYYVECDRSL